MKKALAIILLLSIVLSCSSSLAADAQLRASELIIDSVIYAFDYGSGNIEFGPMSILWTKKVEILC